MPGRISFDSWYSYGTGRRKTTETIYPDDNGTDRAASYDIIDTDHHQYDGNEYL